LEYKTDIDLAKVLQKGSQKAFVDLINKYQKSVFNTCMGFVHNSDDAQDITQDVFIEVFESINKFRGDAKLSTWIYRIAVNKSLNYVRNSKKRSFFQSIDSLFVGDIQKKKIDVIDANYEPQEQMEQNEMSDVLNKAINSLPKKQQIAFVMHKYEDLSYKSIAEVMEVSLSSVESLIYRAKVGLQKKLINFYKNNNKE
jgi:RNA polymerase sigma-70 factor (ECF subfamily)